MKLKLTRERIILGGVLLAAAVGLMVDQATRQADASAVSAVDEYALPPISVTSGTAKNLTSSITPITPERSLAARLKQLAGPVPSSWDSLRDVFARAGSAARPIGAASAENSAAWASRTLNGVLFGPDGKCVAIVDNKLLRVGMRLDGMKLISVTPTKAVFTNGTSEITLRLKDSSQNLGQRPNTAP